MQHRLNQNAPRLNRLGALATVLMAISTVIGIIFLTPSRWAIPKLWPCLSRLFSMGKKRPRITLHFVAMDFPNNHWGIESQDGKPITVIVTKWRVTHEPGFLYKMPVHLLKVHLLKPFVKYLIRAQVITMSGEFANTPLENNIPEGQTRTLIIRCYLSKVLKSKKRLKVRLAVEDQLENKHKLPPILVSPLSMVNPSGIQRKQYP